MAARSDERAPTATAAGTPGGERQRAGSAVGAERGWDGVGVLAALWALGYGGLGVAWALGAPGFPYGSGDPAGETSLFTAATAPTAGVVIAALGAALAGLALVLARGWGRGGGRTAALWAGGLLAAALLLLVPDQRVLASVGYGPVFLIGAPFGFPDFPYTQAWPWPVVNQALVIAGGLLLAWATLRYGRRTAHGVRPAWATPEAAARWGRWAVGLAVAVPVFYAATRFAWALGISLGMSPEQMAEGRESGLWILGTGLGGGALGGALLTLGLVQRWGEVFPRWTPGLTGRRVPPGLAIVPALAVAVLVTATGVTMVRLLVTGALPVGLTEAFAGAAILPMLLFPVWGAALAVATLAYAIRRRVL